MHNGTDGMLGGGCGSASIVLAEFVSVSTYNTRVAVFVNL